MQGSFFRNAFFFGKKNDDPFYGLPESLRSAIAFRMNAKDDVNFVLRNDGVNDFVVSYTDPISELMLNQSVASLQPIKVLNGAEFTNKNIFTGGVFANNQIKAMFVVANSFLNVFSNNQNIASVRITNQNGLNLFGSTFPPQTNISSNGGGGALIKVNNITTFSFLPMNLRKTVYTQSSLLNRLNAGIGQWSGRIDDVILFNRPLSDPEITLMHNYLTTFHNL